jgi:hypothetical protein
MHTQFTLPFYDVRSYLLGVFDGEGCIATCRTTDRRRYWYLKATVSMTAKDVIDLFLQTWGGNYHKRKSRNPVSPPLHDWSLSAAAAIPFLEFAAEHSIAKSEQCRIALTLARSMARYSWNGQRRGVNLNRGKRVITDDEMEERNRLVLQIRALNGARSRFGVIASGPRIFD